MEATPSSDSATAAAAKWRSDFSRAFQYYLDRSTPHAMGRWVGTLAVAAVYVLRVYLIQGFYIVSYGMGIYVLNLLIGFLSPMVDPEIEALDGPSLPTRGSDEFKPFIQRLPEFKFCKGTALKGYCKGRQQLEQQNLINEQQKKIEEQQKMIKELQETQERTTRQIEQQKKDMQRAMDAMKQELLAQLTNRGA